MKRIKDKSERKQIEKAKDQMQESIFIHLAAMIEESSIEEVFSMLHCVANEMKLRKRLEKQYKKSKFWIWAF